MATQWVKASVLAILAVPGGIGVACGSRDDVLRDSLPAGSRSPVVVGGLGTPSPPSCGPSGEAIYLLDDHGVLHSFAPPLDASSSFRTVGQVTCTLPDGTPWSGAGNMALDASGTAWVTDTVGQLFRVNTADASCQATTFTAGQSGFSKVGMAFVDDATGAQALYFVDNSSGPGSTGGMGLARVDLATLLLSPIGDFDQGLTGRVAELGGASDGSLVGFFPGSDSSVAQIDPSDAHVISATPVPVSLTWSGPTHIATAFSRWSGGDYLYVANSSVAPFTDVRSFDPSTGVTQLVRSQIGFDVTGAGTAACKPAPSM